MVEFADNMTTTKERTISEKATAINVLGRIKTSRYRCKTRKQETNLSLKSVLMVISAFIKQQCAYGY